MAERRYRKVSSEQAGYAPGRWVVQYYDANIGRWFDVGDPLDEAGATARLKEKQEEE